MSEKDCKRIKRKFSRYLEVQVFILGLLIFFAVPSAFSMSNEKKREVNRIMNLPMAQLTEEAVRLLEEKFPEEDWETYNFPQFVYTNESVEASYKIAVKTPQLFAKIACVCLCDVAKGHQSLLDCYLKSGKSEREYTDHAVNCDICLTQALWAFLWAEAGASEKEIIKLMPTKPEPRKLAE